MADTHLVPRHKADYAACDRLRAAPDEQVRPLLPELLTWLQDINWPVAPRVVDRIRSMGGDLVPPVREILCSDDGIWKYWVLTQLLPVVDAAVVGELRADVVRLATTPTPHDRADEVDIAARELLDAAGVGPRPER